MILAFDSSATHIGVTIGTTSHEFSKLEIMQKGQVEALFDIISQVLKETDADWSDIKKIAVGVGPGNFTGIRLSISAAKGLALSLNIPVIGVSRLAAMAWQTKGEKHIVLDARQEKVYLQSFKNGIPNSEPSLTTKASIPSDDLIIEESLSDQINGSIFDLRCLTKNMAAMAQENLHNTLPVPLYIRTPDAAPGRLQSPTIIL